MKYAIKWKVCDKWLDADILVRTPPERRAHDLAAYAEKKDRVLFRDRELAHTICRQINGQWYAGTHVVVRIKEAGE